LQELPEAKTNYYFAHIDGVDHLTLVALDPDDPDEIVALVRYDREAGSERAEYSALVEDLWQGHGGEQGKRPDQPRGALELHLAPSAETLRKRGAVPFRIEEMHEFCLQRCARLSLTVGGGWRRRL
jgi:hypothetical protein